MSSVDGNVLIDPAHETTGVQPAQALQGCAKNSPLGVSSLGVRNDEEACSDASTFTLATNATPTQQEDAGAEREVVDVNRAILERTLRPQVGIAARKKQLLILDVNGLLVARYKKVDWKAIPPGTKHGVVAKTYMFKRPFCDAFLAFCFEHFDVGVWSSMVEANVHKALQFICRTQADTHNPNPSPNPNPNPKFVFVMHQGDCTLTGLRNPEKTSQPLFLKELRHVWTRFSHLGFNASNTLLIDDTPYKALRNPPHTAIFPEAYLFNDADTFLMRELAGYLTLLRDALDVREFVRAHPFGAPAIAAGCLHWNIYRKALNADVREIAGASVRVGPQTRISSLTKARDMAMEQRMQNLALNV